MSALGASFLSGGGRRAVTRLGVLLVLGAAGCSATTLRVAVAPTLDTGARIGVEATLALGVGLAVDRQRRSHHFMQARGVAGGGYDGRADGGVVVMGADVDYLHWGGRIDLRAGVHFASRIPAGGGGERLGAGGQLSAVVALYQDGEGWRVRQVCIGGEVRAGYLWNDDRGGSGRGLFALALVGELNVLAAGD